MEITLQDIPTKYYLGKTAKVSIDTLENNPIFQTVYKEVGTYVQGSGITPTGPAVAIYKTWKPEENSTTVMPAFTVEQHTEAGPYELFHVPQGKAYVALHKGPYSTLKQAHGEVMTRMQQDGVTGTLTVEEYLVFPQGDGNDDNCETRLLYYL